VQERAGEATELVVERDGRSRMVTITPEGERVGQEGEEETVGRIGVTLPRRDPGAVASLGYGLTQTWDWTVLILGFLGDLITGDASPRNLGGPILIGQVSGEVARAGLAPLLNFMGMFSINLAILNLLPIPLLDGGHLLFLAVEAVRGRRLSLELRMRLSQLGFVIVLAIMVWAIANDVLRLFGL
ncbi:MAG: site-2 protease family protein, partial [Gemmatimonadota bacterium]